MDHLKIATGFVALVSLWPVGQAALQGADQDGKDLSQQIFDTMLQLPGNKPGHRLVHAKGIVCQGTFAPSEAAATLSRAAHFSGPAVPATVRFSDGNPDPAIADGSPDANPRGMAIRFSPPGSTGTDIVAMSHNGFVVGTAEEFLALQKAVVATDPAKPHPWPIEKFLSTHPAAMKFVQELKSIPVSFGTESFFANDAFVLVNRAGAKQSFRYQILPVAGPHSLSEADAKSKSPDFFTEEIKTHLAKEPMKFRLVAQLPNAGDPTKDPSIVWPADRKTVDLGTITITSVVADSAAAERALAFDPTRLTDGIEPSDDPLPALRSRVYALSAAHRRGQKQ